MRIVVVGAGLWGAVIAERVPSELKEPVLVVEERGHVGGNCHSSVDAETGIECHRYGSHEWEAPSGIAHQAPARSWPGCT